MKKLLASLLALSFVLTVPALAVGYEDILPGELMLAGEKQVYAEASDASEVVAACAAGETHIINAARLRLKESDRLTTTAQLLRAIGAQVEELADGLILRHSTFTGGTVDAYNDHRIAMSAAIAASLCPVTVAGSDCVSKSYPRFWEDYAALKGAAL